MFIQFLVVTCLLNCVQCANILGVFMFPSISHQIVFQPLWKELSLRGHQVTVVTPDPLNDPALVNLTEISVKFTYDILKKNRLEKIFSKENNPFELLPNLLPLVESIIESELNSTKFKDLIHDQSKIFDLIIFECFNPVYYALSARFKAPTIAITSLGAPLQTHDSIGNFMHPAIYSDTISGFLGKSVNLKQRVLNTLYHLWYRLYYYNVVLPRAHQIAVKYFGNDIPYVGDLERNVSMVFLNENPLLYPPRPDVPALIQMGQMHIKPVQPLPNDLQVILDEAREGVIYFSLGSNVKSINIPGKLRHVIIEALSELPYKVLWKWESDHLPGKPKNVVTRIWLPQQDVLAHPNIKAFVTQGGLQSIEEAISRNVPLIGMPFMGDQPMNVHKIVDLGLGLQVDPFTVTKDELKKAIVEVVENQRYRKKVKEMNELLKDQPMTGLERAVWWAEYVIRHKGASHLRSPTAEIPWYQFMLLDVIAVLLFPPIVSTYVLYKMTSWFKRKYKHISKVKIS